VVVAYAATGRTPFAADSAPATAMRILTQPPDLSGLPGSLRDLVAQALVKNPDERPTARGLLDALLAGDTPQAGVTTAVAVAASEALAARVVNVRSEEAPTVGRPGAERRRRGLRGVAVTAAVLIVLFGAGLAGLRALSHSGQDTADNPSRAGIPGTSAPVSPSLSTAGSKPSAVETNAAILRGNRRTLIHLAEIDRDLALDYHDYDVAASDGTGTKSQFVLVPMGVDYLIKSLRGEGHTDDSETCLGVKVVPDKTSTLVAADCGATKATVFSLNPTGAKDDKNRPTYRIYNEAYGFVQWSATRKVVFVEEVGDADPTASFSFVDRGAI
jgi:eukaryotic-like serine/threonine-protein kinase